MLKKRGDYKCQPLGSNQHTGITVSFPLGPAARQIPGNSALTLCRVTLDNHMTPEDAVKPLIAESSTSESTTVEVVMNISATIH
jgi:hypothetical protein